MATITFVDIASLAKKTPDGSEKIPISSTQYVAVSDIMGQLNYVECTYAELVTLRNATQLQAGNYYLITDYQTIYVQPNTNAVKTSLTIEPLLVLAISDSDISNQAWSINNPKHTIFYDIDGTNYQWVYVNTTMISHKGVITQRIDEYGNDLPYDFKAIKFARYKIDIGSIETWVTEVKTYGKEDLVKANSGDAIYMCIQNTPYNTDSPEDDNSPYWIRLIKASGITGNTGDKWYFSCNTSLDIKVFVEDYTVSIPILNSDIKEFYTFDDNGVDASISGSVKHNIIKYSSGGLGKYILPNIVFMDASIVSYNTIGADSMDNTIGGDAYSNTIGRLFTGNVIGFSMEENTIKDAFMDNLIGVLFSKNYIGYDFKDNYIETVFSNNIVGNDSHDNIIRDGFTYNKLGNSCYSNIICGITNYVSLGANCSGNFMLSWLTKIAICDSVTDKDLQAIDIYSKEYNQSMIQGSTGSLIVWWYGTGNSIETLIIS